MPILQADALHQKYCQVKAEPHKLLTEPLLSGKDADDEAEESKESDAAKTLEGRYSQLDQLLRADVDAQFGIIRVIEANGRYPTGFAALRDATEAKAITDPSINHHRVEADNMLLRALGRLRGIDHVLMEKEKETLDRGEKDVYARLRKQLKDDFTQLSDSAFRYAEIAKSTEGSDPKEKKKAFALYNEGLKNLENNFNTQTLCSVLHEANLDEQCAKKKDYEKLLFHYRNLAALLDPAVSLVTISYDKDNKVLHRITQDPITQKLPEQKRDIQADMSKTVLFPVGDERNFQTMQNMAMQEANRHFATLAASDDRMFGAQTRKTHLHSAKNAFFVTNELLFNVTPAQLTKQTVVETRANLEDTQQFTRSATPVYIGKGETDARVQESTRRNIEQIRQFVIKKQNLSVDEANKLKMHYTCLVTDSPLASQNVMIRHGYDATRRGPAGNDISYIPCNWDGTHRRLDLAASVGTQGIPSIHPTPSNQAERYRRAAQVSNIIRGKDNVFELVTCASGQDRTETESERASQEWARERYRTNGVNLSATPAELKKHGDAVEQTRATSRNSAEINAHVVGGSRGCKGDSRGKTALIDYDNLYSRDTDQAMYLASAKTNKGNKVAGDTLKAIMKSPSPIADSQYKTAKEHLTRTCDESPFSHQTQAAGETVLREVEAAKTRVKHKDVGTLTRTLQEAATVVQRPEPRQGNIAYAEKISRLGAIAKGLNKKSILKKIGGALLVLGGAALIAAGILFTIPSGGSSLLGCLLGAKMLAIGASAALGVTTMAAGAGATYTGKKLFDKNTREGVETEKGLIQAAKELDQPGSKAKKDNRINPSPSSDGLSLHKTPLLSDEPSSPSSSSSSRRNRL
jgi:hypothetical protein